MSANSPRGDPVNKFDPSKPKVEALRRSLSNAYEELQKAHLAYEQALSIAGDPPSSKDLTALRQAGGEYAVAVAKHTDAVMAWLAMVERSI
jgi:hypothetical protein